MHRGNEEFTEKMKISNKIILYILLFIVVVQAFVLLAWGKIEAVEMVEIEKKAQAYESELNLCIAEKDEIFTQASTTIVSNNELVRKYNALLEINKELAEACEKYCPGNLIDKKL